MLNRSGTRTVLAGLLVSAMGLAFLVVGCSSTGGGVGGALTRVIGQASAPETDGNQQNAVPLGEGTVVLLQYDDDGTLQRAMVGTTDDDGNFVVDVQAQAEDL